MVAEKDEPCNCGMRDNFGTHYSTCSIFKKKDDPFIIQTSVRYGDTDYPVRLERCGRGREWTFAGYVSKDLYRIGTSLVVDAVAAYTGVTPEEIRRECSSTSYRNDEFVHVVFCRRGVDALGRGEAVDEHGTGVLGHPTKVHREESA